MKNSTNSFFSPNRLVFMAGGPSKTPGGSADKPKPGVDTKAARAEFLKNAKAKIDGMKDGNPKKEELNTMWLHCHMAETFSKTKAQDHAMNLMQRLGEVSGNKTLERKTTLARREIQNQRQRNYVVAKGRAQRMLKSAYAFNKPKQWSVNGKTYETTMKGRISGPRPTFHTKEIS